MCKAPTVSYAGRVPAAMHWEAPSAAAAELIRATAERLLENPQPLFDEIDAAVIAMGSAETAADPGIVAAMQNANHANLLRWTRANVRAPGEPVPPNVSAETLDVLRDLVRRGRDDPSDGGYRIGQSIAWRRWMAAVFELSSDPATLREALDVSSLSMSSFVEGTLAGIREQIEHEREGLERGLEAERLETVWLILDGAPIAADRASLRLRYELGRRHTACILWSPSGAAAQGELERAAEALGRACGGRRPFTVAAGSASLWAWLASGDEDSDLAALDAVDLGAGGMRAAIGPTAEGIDGFRRSHMSALGVQRLMQRMPAERRIARHGDVQLVALASHDPDESADFVTRSLGDLATAPAELRETLRAYLREGSSATRCARATFTHRNTVLGRLGRARELLPAPLEGRSLEVGLALEIVRWLGPPA